MISSLLGVAAVTLVASACTPAPLPPPHRFTMSVPEDRALNAFVVSADGQWLAYSAETASDGLRRIFVRPIAPQPGPDRELPDSVGGSLPFFSPDGSQVGFFARGWIWRAARTGEGKPARIGEAPVDSAGATWTTDDHIVFAPLGDRGLMALPASGGAAVSLTSLNAEDGELEHGWPHAIADGLIAFTVSQRGRDPHLELLSRDRTRTRLRVPLVGQAQSIATEYLVYGYLGNLMAVRLDAVEKETRGVPVTIAKGLQTVGGFGTLGRSGFSVSANGTLVSLDAAPDDARSRLVRVMADGKTSPLSMTAEAFQTPRLSPDTHHIAVVARSGVMTRDIQVIDAAKPDRRITTIAGGDNHSPAWLDNRRLSFGSNRDGAQKIYVAAVGAKRPPHPLFTTDVAVPRNPGSWSRPPTLLAFYEIGRTQRRDVLIYRVGESVVPLAASDANERSPSVSHDGRLVAYVSDEAGRDEVFLAPLAGDGGSRRVTTGGATEPVWSRLGLHYRQGDRMMFRPLHKGALGEPVVVFEGHFERDPGSNLAAYDVDPAGRYFIMLKSALKPRELSVVLNWRTELVAVTADLFRSSQPCCGHEGSVALR